MARRQRTSRLQRTEKRKSVRSATFYIILTIAGGLAFLFFGLPAIARFAAFVADLGKSGETISIEDTTAPPPPRIDSLPEATNKDSITVEGSSEAGTNVTIYTAGNKTDVLADNESRFSVKVDLSEGENEVYAVARDDAGNESTDSGIQVVVYDITVPELVILEPDAGQVISVSPFVIKGNTDADADVQVNGRMGIVGSSGEFRVSYELQEGENVLEVIATDPAGNEQTKSVTVTYQP